VRRDKKSPDRENVRQNASSHSDVHTNAHSDARTDGYSDTRTDGYSDTRADGYSDTRMNSRHRAAYDRVARRFAVVNADVPAQVAASAEEFLAAVGANGIVLDLGCGHGRDIAWFEARGLRVVGADLSAGMLSQARCRARGPLVQADMRYPPFRDRTFRGIWCNAAILHLPKSDLACALGEIHRILETGGVFFVAIQVGAGEGWEKGAYDQPVERFFARYTPDEFASSLATAGFAVVSQDDSRTSPTRHWAHFLAKRGG
jgi:SAM-dependent methyltransferase